MSRSYSRSWSKTTLSYDGYLKIVYLLKLFRLFQKKGGGEVLIVNPIQVRLFLPFKDPGGGSFGTPPPKISGTIQNGQMKPIGKFGPPRNRTNDISFEW